jgi:prepilin-type processing-associated H-X9-DG protein
VLDNNAPVFEGEGLPRATARLNCYRFGSAHPGAFHAVFVDGSVHTIEYGVDLRVFNALGDMMDGTKVDVTELD